MKVTRTSTFVFVALIAMALATSAFATSVTMTYEGQHGVSNQNGGNPYYFSISGSSTLTPLMCDSYDNDVTRGQTWNASALPLLQGIASSMFGSSMALDYRAAGLIFKSMLAGTLSTTQAQWAVWGLFSANAQSNPYFGSINAGGIDATYLALAQTAPNSAYNGLILYTPLNAKPGVGPQEFIGFSPVPEPGTMTLLGTGLIGLAGAIRRKLAKV